MGGGEIDGGEALKLMQGAMKFTGGGGGYGIDGGGGLRNAWRGGGAMKLIRGVYEIDMGAYEIDTGEGAMKLMGGRGLRN